MSKRWIISDAHMGHNNICKYRTQFKDAEEHHKIIYENICSTVGKRDSIYFLGDIAFKEEWLIKIGEIKCGTKILILGNHCVDKIHFSKMVGVYDKVYSLFSKENFWLTHCPIHESEIRKKELVIHGHTHDALVQEDRYVNVCVEHIDYKPYLFTKSSIYELRDKQNEIKKQIQRG